MDRINDWKVHEEDYLTDHKLISFTLDFSKPKPSRSRNFKKANWSYFKSLLAKTKWTKPRIWSKKTITKEANKLIVDITKCVQKKRGKLNQSHQPGGILNLITSEEKLERHIQNGGEDLLIQV